LTRKRALWFPLSVDFWDDPDIIAVGESAGILFQKMIGYAKKHRTGGKVPVKAIRSMGGRWWKDRLSRLTNQGLIRQNDGQDAADCPSICRFSKWNKALDSDDNEPEEFENHPIVSKPTQVDVKEQSKSIVNIHTSGCPEEASSSLPDLFGEDQPKSSRERAIKAVFDVWVAEHVGQHRRHLAKLNKKRRSLIEARLREGYSAEQLIAAIRNAKNSPFHMGENKTGQKYVGLQTILRDGEQVEKFESLVAPPPKDGWGPRTL
jgi:hypothetical protein